MSDSRLKHGPGLELVDAFASRAARQIGRREMLRTLGKVGLTVGLSLGFLGTRFAPRARAMGSCTGGACGPSPLCPNADKVCAAGGAAGFCKVSLESTTGRVYGTFTCDTVGGCWTEPSSGTYGCACKNPGKWKCCDCCHKRAGGSLCSGSDCDTTSLNACICRKKLQPAGCNANEILEVITA